MPISRGTDLLHRWERNPILTLEDVPYRCNTVFNATPVVSKGQLLLRSDRFLYCIGK